MKYITQCGVDSREQRHAIINRMTETAFLKLVESWDGARDFMFDDTGSGVEWWVCRQPEDNEIPDSICWLAAWDSQEEAEKGLNLCNKLVDGLFANPIIPIHGGNVTIS